MRKYFVSLSCLIIAATAFPGRLHATGGFSQGRWLDNGGIASDMSPEFYWEIELKRLARPFVPREKRVLPPAPPGNDAPDHEVRDGATLDLTAKADAEEFADAIKTGRIKPPDVEKAKAAHKSSRELVTGGTELPEEFPSEFADYHRGAFAFRKGKDHYDEARAAWEALLQRPEAERHYRSVWAAFMLGKLALAMEDGAAVKWFRETRELAAKGFADAVGLAADSYGWEARSELDQHHFEAAAKLYLTQLALGDESAIVSLKAVIPDRPMVDGMMNYKDGPPVGGSEAELKKWEESETPLVQKYLDECARSPLLRKLETAHVLATETQEAIWSYGADSDEEKKGPSERCRQWLATLEKAGLRHVDDADHLGWVAYTVGQYKEAARWLKMARPDSPTALWLKAKLQRRDGKYAQAAATMSAALKGIRDEALSFDNTDFSYGERSYDPEQSAAGDLAGLHLTRGEFTSAMEVFLEGNLLDDASFIADRVMTVDELKKYVDAHFPKATVARKEGEMGDTIDIGSRMRWMLARRLVRERHFDEARPYFQEKERAALRRYTSALTTAENNRLGKLERARAYFTAAWIARHSGMELMGTEEEPDGFVNEGNFPIGHLDVERVGGVRTIGESDDPAEEDSPKKKPAKLSIPATAEERRRLTANSPHPTRRYHYRWVAADLAWRAAALMNDGTEELADVLNTGGTWIKDRDERGADKFVQAIERRCPRTEIGNAESVKHWFVDQSGPWSNALEKEDAANSPDAQIPQ